ADPHGLVSVAVEVGSDERPDAVLVFDEQRRAGHGRSNATRARARTERSCHAEGGDGEIEAPAAPRPQVRAPAPKTWRIFAAPVPSRTARTTSPVFRSD